MGPRVRTYAAPISFGRITTTRSDTKGHPEAFTETVGTLNVGTTFSELARVVFQPGLPASFPRLSKIASRYKQYVVQSARIIVRPTAQTGITGKFVIIPNYSQVPTPPLDYIQAANVEGNVTSSLWLEASSRLDVKNTKATGARKYVRTAGSTAEDVADYDCVTWYIFGAAESAINDFASVLIEYDILFYAPTVEQTGELSVEGVFMNETATVSVADIDEPGTHVYNITPEFIEVYNDGEPNPPYSVMAGFEVSEDGNAWVCQEDGVYCLCASTGMYAVNEDKQHVYTELTMGFSNDLEDPNVLTLVDASRVYNFAQNNNDENVEGDVSLYSEFVVPLAKGARIAWQAISSVSETADFFWDTLMVSAQLIGSLVL